MTAQNTVHSSTPSQPCSGATRHSKSGKRPVSIIPPPGLTGAKEMTQLSNAGEETFHSIFSAYSLSKQAINDMLTLRKLNWYSTLSHNTVIATFNTHLQEQQGEIPNTQPLSVTGLADLKGRVKTHPMKLHSTAAQMQEQIKPMPSLIRFPFLLQSTLQLSFPLLY